MTKKKYIRPETSNVAAMERQELLAGSTSVDIDKTTQVPGEEALSKESNFDDFDDTDIFDTDYSSPAAWQ